MVKLKHETDARVANARQLLFRQLGQAAPAQDHRACGGPIQSAQQVQQRRFAGAARANDRYSFARRYCNVYPLQDAEFAAIFLCVSLAQVVADENGIPRHGLGEGRRRNHVVTHAESLPQASAATPARPDKSLP